MKRQLYAVVNNYGSKFQMFDIVGITDKPTSFPIIIEDGKLYVEIQNKENNG